MSIWTESELRQDEAALRQLTLNVAFLADIKQDSVRPRELVELIQARLGDAHHVDFRKLAEELESLRDELETHFALEEFYGYFESAAISHPGINARATWLRSQHETIFLDLCELVDLAEGLCYGEHRPERALEAIRAGFHSFVQQFNRHEEEEGELMMRMCTEDFGVGD
jgi:hypothetical protein